MASLLTHKHGEKAGAKYIRFFRNGKREMVYLGHVSDRVATTVKMHVEELLSAKSGGLSPAPPTAKWLTTIDPQLSQKLANVGLIDVADAKSVTASEMLGPFLDTYLAMRTDVKPTTKLMFEQVRGWLVDFFKADKRLDQITPGDADEWRLWLAKQSRYEGKSLSKNTIRRHCARARQFFNAAKKKKLITENPFSEMRDTSVKSNRERDHFVTREEADKVLAKCPNTQWKLLFSLSRYGGLRCPSEHLALTWADVDFDRGRMTVRSPKTEHHDGKASRVVPIFPELRPYLEAAKAEAEPGAKHVVTIGNIRRDRYANPRSTMQKIIKRAGVKPWPKLFHNLRASRETELAQVHPMHVVCDWIGNSPKVAAEHYLRTTDADFEKAAGKWEASREPSCAPNGSQNGCPPSMADSGLLSQIVQKALENGGLEPLAATIGQLVQNHKLAGAGLEPARPLTGHRILSGVVVFV
jgi:integrase